jgi:DNA-3-methyladenine glycosylase
LIRALEPLEGVKIMMKNRGIRNIYSLTNGPGKLTKALAITKDLNGIDVTERQ